MTPLFRWIALMAALLVPPAHAGVPNFQPATIENNGVVVLRSMQSITVSFETNGTVLTRPKIQPRQTNEADTIYMEFDATVQHSVRNRLNISNKTGNSVTVQGSVTYAGDTKPHRFTVRCPHGEWISKAWPRSISEVRVTGFTLTPPANR